MKIAGHSLFSKHAFENGDPTPYPNLALIGREIVKKCKGLPLAAKTLGGLLRYKLDVEEWGYICKSEIWDLPNDKSKILPALKLSYHFLPSRLKRCFAYCATFPKDYVFQKEELVLLWMAHNFLLQQPNNKITMEEVGDMCFRELLSRSFFQQSSGKESSFVMHDLIHDLAHFVSGEFICRLDDDKQPCDISGKVRHFSYARSGDFSNNYDTFDKFKEINNVKCLRGFLPLQSQTSFLHRYLASKVLHDMLPTLRCLRVLSLSCYEITELPHSIANLIHLRYLDVSYTNIRFLPKSITTMFNLQTLLLSSCYYIEMLPQNMRKLICLRRLDLSGTRLKEMPFGMDKLKSLRFLSTFVVGKHGGSSINALGELSNLQNTLSIKGLENVTNCVDALVANLKGKKHLEGLVLEWSRCTDNSRPEIDVLEKLQPHKKLKDLTIDNFGGEKFPTWLGEHLFDNMISLSLKSCGNCLLLPQLGQLPSLKFLTITRMKRITVVGLEFFGDDSLRKPFPALETLKFVGMTEWEEWHMLGAGEFSCLKELHMIDCPKLTGNLPNQVTSLRRLEISGCHRLVASLPNGRVTIFCNQVGLLQYCLSSLQRLVISDILNLAELPPELSAITNLEELKIEKCRSLESFPAMGLPSGLGILTIKECDALKSLPINTFLEKLVISQCSSLVSFASVGGLPTMLKTLEIWYCRKLELPDEMEHCYASIEELALNDSCDSLKTFPLGLCPKLIRLKISYCLNFETLSIPNGLENHIQLQHVIISYCPNLVSFPDGGLRAPDLQSFTVMYCDNLKSLPSFFPSLQSLIIDNCPKLEHLSEGSLPSNLEKLNIELCLKLMAHRRNWGLQKLPSLREFAICGEYIEEEDVWKTFPEEWLLPSSLSTLVISHAPNLKSLNHKGMKHLTSLKTLSISNCFSLESLSKEVLPSSLSKLIISKCPLLTERCQREKGEDWPNIAIIPFIQLDDEKIF